MNNTKHVILVMTLLATAPVVANRFVGFDGKQAKANAPVLGVAPRDADQGDTMGVETIGIVLVESGGAVNVGDKIAADAQGCAVVATGDAVGYAVSASSEAGELIAVLLRG